MSIMLANRIQQVKPSPTLAVAATAAKMKSEGKDVISLGTGEPDFDTPQNIKEAAITAIEDGFTKYTPVDGIASLKEAVCNKFKRENNLNYSASQVLISVGAKQALYNLCQALLNDGDEVLIPAPYWVSYPDMVLLAGAVPVVIPTQAANHYKMKASQLEQAITPKTRMIFINSPSNPSGVAYTAAELKELAEILVKHPNIVIASDDIYEHILWSQPFVNILNVCPDLYEQTVVFNGVSKAYAMTGWRIGYAAGSELLIKAMKTIQSQSTSNPCSIAQKAALEALNGSQEAIAVMLKAFHERHDAVLSRLKNIDGVHAVPADGTFYLFPDVSQVIARKGYKDDIAFSEALLNEQGVALVPGSAFGAAGCIRLSFATDMQTLNKAMDRIQQFVDG